MTVRDTLDGADRIDGKAMVATGELISAEALCERLRIGPARLYRFVHHKNIFSIDVDGVVFYPVFFAQRLGSPLTLAHTCQIISPAPVEARFRFLTLPRKDLNGRRALDCLADTDGYSRITELAQAWIESQFRTSVRGYQGLHSVEPDDGSAVLSAASDCDPSEHVWTRARKVIDIEGGEHEDGSNELAQTATFFVSQSSIFNGTELQAKVYVEVVDNKAHVRTERIVHFHGKDVVVLADGQNVQSIVRSILDALDHPGPGCASRL
ncbi:hypothetical protein [Caballeronia sp. S22]|uniref:hypothetical protein n=1 Tax=Caballeronia sp. S22 TaxID=3137182 RepID=UPI003530DDFF